ncbi:MAG: chemotaxis protein CheX [Planctomycetes bacterium]|nr:chemotaxis protein CheX [Planctomycetota bacterium]
MSAIEGVIESIASDITDATKTLFETMIMLDLKYDESSLVDETQIKTDVIGMVSFTGKYHGVIGLFCSKKFALKVASTMLMTELNEFTHDVKDAVGEISNMIAGNVKTKLTAQYGDMNLSIPIVIAGEGLSITAVNNHPVVADTTLSCFSKDPWLMTPFISVGEKFNVGLLLKESGK